MGINSVLQRRQPWQLFLHGHTLISQPGLFLPEDLFVLFAHGTERPRVHLFSHSDTAAAIPLSIEGTHTQP